MALDSYNSAIAARVRAARLAANLSHEELGRQLGLTKAGYGHYERGRQPFTLELLLQLATIFNTSLAYFLGLDATELRLDEQALLTAYRRLDGSPWQATLLSTIMEMCRIWSQAQAGPAGLPRGSSLQPQPLGSAQEQPAGPLRSGTQGLSAVGAAAVPAAAAPARPANAQRFAALLEQIQADPVRLAQLDRFLQALLAQPPAIAAPGLPTATPT